jgi:hypothetical protein
MSERAGALAVILAACAGLATLLVCAPAYMTARGFPLDDAWIHAVYGRALARSGTFSFNPDIPATGATSPLWPVMVAIPHLLWTDTRAVVLATKLLGFGLHVLTALGLYLAWRDGTRASPERVLGASLVAFHPDLVSASVSGMEVPLATLAASAILVTARRCRAWTYAALCVVAPLARPELAIVCGAVPVILFIRRDHRRLAVGMGAALAGAVISFGFLALRNLAVSGRPLPATFYAKVGTGELPLLRAEIVGFRDLLGRLAIVDSSVLLTVLAAGALYLALSSRTAPPSALSAAALLSGLAFCAVSFVLIRPYDPYAFYHQRYVLPALPLLVAPSPLLALDLLERIGLGRLVAAGRLALGLWLGASLLIEAPGRYRSLANDAHNIDDVQVAVGRSLAAASPRQVVWAVDVGAVRYFGNAFVVDLIGLNEPRIIGPSAQTFLAEHPPDFIELVPTWTELDAGAAQRLPGRAFQTSTRYTVTSVPAMQRHALVACDDAAVSGQLRVRQMGASPRGAPARLFAFDCAGTGPRDRER